MINEVRNYVLAILNKENNGYVTPDQFNLFAKQAQLEIFEEYFTGYALALQKMNARVFGSGHADIVQRYEEVINLFTVPSQTLVFAGGSFLFPTDLYKINYPIYQGFRIDAVSQDKLVDLLASSMAAPTTLYPAYTTSDTSIQVYPTSIQSNVSLNYTRYPLDPKWTYVTAGDAPLFNPAAVDYQDFELPLSDMMNLIIRICQSAGVTIREEQVVAMAKSDEIQDKQE